MKAWVYDPHSGGNKIPSNNHWQIQLQADKFAKTRPWCVTHELKLRFRNQFCYLDGLKKGEKTPFPLGRLRYFRDNTWSLAFYTYSNERYEPCFFPSGKLEGTLEEALSVCEMYLN